MEKERMIKRLLRSMGAGETYCGFQYTVYGIILVLEDKERLTAVTKLLYPEIARHFHTTPWRVERNIRTVVTVVWKKSDGILKEIIGGPDPERRPTNSEFFERICRFIQGGCCLDGEEQGEAAFVAEENLCELTGRICMRLLERGRELENEKEENLRLRKTVCWMHDLIWALLSGRRRELLESAEEKRTE